MRFQKASEADFYTIQKFYWDVIENIHRNNVDNENLGWEKLFVRFAIYRGEIKSCGKADWWTDETRKVQKA